MKLNTALAKSTAVAALGGLLFGFDTAVISGTTAALTRTYHLSPHLLGVTVSSALIGTILGAMLAGFPGEWMGRRDSLRVMAVLYAVSAVGCAGAWSWGALVAFRMIGGLGIGGSSVLGPMYIAEIAPAATRGRLVGCFQLSVVLGILLAYFSNYEIALRNLGAAEWRWDFGVAAAPALAFFGLVFAIPRSPRWLAKKGRDEEARAVLEATSQDAAAALQDIRESLGVERSQGQGKLFTRRYAFPVFLAVSIGLLNQLSGINAILYYMNDMFARAGFTKASGNLQAVIVGATNMIFTVLAMSMIDRFGRKTLLLIGSLGTAGCLFGVSWVFFTGRRENELLWLLIGYIAFFAFSQGAVIWVFLAEVFPTAVRAKGQSLGSFSHWAMNATISLVYPVVAARSGAYPFAFFGAMMVAQFFMVLFVYPETKGLSLEEMQKHLLSRKLAS